MTHIKINRKTIRTLISEEQANGQPVTGTDDHQVAVDIAGRLGLHPAYKNKVREIFNCLVKRQEIVLKDAVVTIVPEDERRQAAYAAELANKRQMGLKQRSIAKRSKRQSKADMARRHHDFAETYGLALPA